MRLSNVTSTVPSAVAGSRYWKTACQWHSALRPGRRGDVDRNLYPSVEEKPILCQISAHFGELLHGELQVRSGMSG